MTSFEKSISSKMRFLFLALAIIFYGQSSLATNGPNLIGPGPISRGMGGTGIALKNGAETVLNNPAMVTTKKDFEASFGATYVSANISATNKNAALLGQTSKEVTSAGSTIVLPTIGLAHKVSDSLFFGVGAYATSGGGVDYRETRSTNGLFGFKSSMSILTVAPAVNYRMGGFSLGLSPRINYGTLSLAYQDVGGSGMFVSPGVSDATGINFHLGLGYEMEPIPLTFGLTYLTSARYEFKYQMPEAAADFGASGVSSSDSLSMPTELGFGVAYTPDKFTVAIDYKMVNWSAADGFSTLGWQDQTIIALGLGYNFSDSCAIRAGYNLGQNPFGDNAVKNTASAAPNNRDPIDFFNAVGLPVFTTSHITLGGTYGFSENFLLDLSAVMAPQATQEAIFNAGYGDMTFESKVAMTSFSLSGRWQF